MERPNRKHLTQRLKLVLNFDPFFKAQMPQYYRIKMYLRREVSAGI